MKKSKKLQNLDTKNPGNIVIHVRHIDNNENLPNVGVAIGKTKQKLTDDTGVAVFSEVPSGKISLRVSHDDFVFDHMQFHGKSYTESTISLQPGEQLEVLVYLKTKESSIGLDQLIDAPQFEAPDFDNAGSAEFCDSASIAAAMHSIKLAEQELKNILGQPELIAKRIDELEKRIVFAKHEDPKEMAIRIQEHFGIPKFVEQHPMAPFMWTKCLDVSESLHPLVVERDSLLKVVRLTIAKMHEYAKFIESQDFVGTTIKELESCNSDAAAKNLERMSSHLKTMKLIVTSAKQKIAMIDEYTNKIDTPARLAWITDKVKKPFV